MIDAVIYARYSSDMQREESIDAQVRACKYYAQNFNYNVIGVYADKAKSGMSTRKRDQFNKMMADSIAGAFQAVLVHKLDRFGRNADETLHNKKMLSQNNVDLVSVKERLDETPQGKLMLYVIIGMNEFYSANLAQEVMKGLRENAYKCLYTGGIPPLGYDINEDKTFRINEFEAAAVRFIFQKYADGSGYTEIIKGLSTRGYKTKIGRPFGTNSIHDLLTNEKYTGTYIFNKSVSKDSRGKMNRHKYKSEDQIIRIENGIPAIIDKELWKAVQKRMIINRHRAATNKAKINYLLTGKIFCGICGSAMTGEVRHADGHEYAYYRCSEGKRTKTCTQKSVPKELIEKQVIDQINKRIFSKKIIDSICQRVYISFQNSGSDNQVEQLKLEIAGLDRKISNISRAIADGTHAPELKEMLDDLSGQKKKLQIQIYELETIPDARGKRLDEIKATFAAAADFGNLPEDQQKTIIQKFINRVIVFPTDDGYKVRVIIAGDSSAVDEAINFLDLQGNGSSPPKIASAFAGAIFSSLGR